MADKTKKTVHWHGCKKCHTRYEDNCTASKVDGLCTGCRGGRPWQLLLDNAAPKDCCVQLARLARKDERETYRLAGAHLWWICPDCKRTHPVNPRSDRTTP